MEFVDITGQAQQAVRDAVVEEGILYLFNPHTTAGLTINEGCDPDVRHDLLAVFREIIPLPPCGGQFTLAHDGYIDRKLCHGHH